MARPRKRRRPKRSAGVCDDLQSTTQEENAQGKEEGAAGRTEEEKVNKKEVRKEVEGKGKEEENPEKVEENSGTVENQGVKKGENEVVLEFRESLKERLRPAVRDRRVNYCFRDQGFEEEDQEGFSRKKRKKGNKRKRKASKAKAEEKEEKEDDNDKEKEGNVEKNNRKGGKKRREVRSEENEEKEAMEESRRHSTRASTKPKRMGEFVSDNAKKKKTPSDVRNPFRFRTLNSGGLFSF